MIEFTYPELAWSLFLYSVFSMALGISIYRMFEKTNNNNSIETFNDYNHE